MKEPAGRCDCCAPREARAGLVMEATGMRSRPLSLQFFVGEFVDLMFFVYKTHSSIDYPVFDEGSDFSDNEDDIIS